MQKDDVIYRQDAIDAINTSRMLYSGTWGKGLSMAVDKLKALPSAQPEEAIPVSWIEGQIERLNNMDNYFAKLTADIIKTMLGEWRREQKGGTK